MARPATGQVVRPTPGQPCFALRFRAYGKREYLTLGKPEDGWTLAMAQRELAVVLRDVDLGTWRPPRPDPAPTKNTNPTFHEFASDWFAAKQLEIEKNTASSYGNDLTNHLLPFFKDHRISEITVAEVDRYRQSKVREAAEITAAAENGTPLTVSYVDRLGRSYRRRARPLSARSINMHIDLLAQILTVAVDHGHLPSNPAVGKRRRMKVSKPRPVHLDSAEQIAILLEAAGRLDRGEAVIDVTDRRGRTWTQRHPSYTTGRRAAIATLLLGGGRASSRARPTTPAARDHSAQTAAHVRLDPGRDRQGPHLRDAATRAHRPGLHASGLRARDAPQRRGARAAQGARPGPRLGSEWAVCPGGLRRGQRNIGDLCSCVGVCFVCECLVGTVGRRGHGLAVLVVAVLGGLSRFTWIAGRAVRQLLGWCSPRECFPGAAVELIGDLVEVGLGAGGQAPVAGEVLAQQAVGVLVGAALPRGVWIAEVDGHAAGDRERRCALRAHGLGPRSASGAAARGASRSVRRARRRHARRCGPPRRRASRTGWSARPASRSATCRPGPSNRSPSQWPGTARSSTSAGRSEIITMSGIRPRCRPDPCDLRRVRPVRRHAASSRRNSPRACTYND